MAVVLALLAGLGFAAAGVFARLAMEHLPTPALTIAGQLAGIVGMFVLSLILYSDQLFVVAAATMGWLALVGFLNYAVGQLGRNMAIRYVGVSRAVSMIAAAPLFAALFAITLAIVA